MLPCLGIAATNATNDLPLRRAELEVQKLELEVVKLRDGSAEFSDGLIGVGGLVVALLASVISVLVARRAQHGALDQSVHEKRLESYPELVRAAARLAVYFPGGDPPVASIGPKECSEMGHAMSKWYFAGGGLLLSVEARDAYFALARALTRASLAEDLKVPTFPRHAGDISVDKLKEYRTELAREHNLDDVENWRFGGRAAEKETLASRFKDFVFLQRLSSAVRTSLTEDLRSRRRPTDADGRPPR